MNSSETNRTGRDLATFSLGVVCGVVGFALYRKLSAPAKDPASFQSDNDNKHVPTSSATTNSKSSLDHESGYKAPSTSKYFAENEQLSQDKLILPCNYDMYNGVRVFSDGIPAHASEFATRLEHSLDRWVASRKRGVMMQLPLHLVPSHLAVCLKNRKYTFRIHHARPDYIMLEKWLPGDADCLQLNKLQLQQSGSSKNVVNSESDDTTNMIPDHCHTYLGVGCLILNRNFECVVIQELWQGNRKNHWKLPGGAVDRLEHIYVAAEREAREETGLQVDFVNLVCLRHIFPFRFGNTGDIYFLTLLRLADEPDESKNAAKDAKDTKDSQSEKNGQSPKSASAKDSYKFEVDPHEIAKIKWIGVDDFLKLPSMAHVLGATDDEDWTITQDLIRKECTWLVENWEAVGESIAKNKTEERIKMNNGGKISDMALNGIRTSVPDSEQFRKFIGSKGRQFVLYHGNAR